MPGADQVPASRTVGDRHDLAGRDAMMHTKGVIRC
jgi:hypothetical protein